MSVDSYFLCLLVFHMRLHTSRNSRLEHQTCQNITRPESSLSPAKKLKSWQTSWRIAATVGTSHRATAKNCLYIGYVAPHFTIFLSRTRPRMGSLELRSSYHSTPANCFFIAEALLWRRRLLLPATFDMVNERMPAWHRQLMDMRSLRIS